MSVMRVLATLLHAVQAETPYGGRATTYDSLGVVWLETKQGRRRERADLGPTRAVEAMTATARTDPRLAEGLILRFGGDDWVVVGLAIDPDRPGRTELSLEVGR